MRRTRRAAILLVCFSTATATAEERPLIIKPYEGAHLFQPTRREYDEVEVALRPGKDKAGVVRLAGRTVFYTTNMPAGRSALEVFRNYEQGLRGAGFSIVHSCGPCVGIAMVKPMGYIGGADRYYVTAKLARAEGDVHAAIFVDHNGARVLTVEAKAMETDKVAVSAAALASGLGAAGHVAIYEILFDTDKAVVKPESKTALDEIAKLLGQQPALKLWVVGHTDAVGAFAHNLDLSKRRAEAVVKELTGSYRVAPARLGSGGVGPLAPVATNKTEEGRAKNRRVELVEQ